MIKIIKDGESTFETRCPVCLCVFSYDTKDLNTYNYVKCPCCTVNVAHENAAKYRREKEQLSKEIERLKRESAQLKQRIEFDEFTTEQMQKILGVKNG